VEQQLSDMHSRGIEQTMPGTNRTIRIRHLDAVHMLREGKMPDILTPLVIKSVYQDVSDRELREFLGAHKGSADDALSFAETVDYVVSKSIADGTKLDSLTMNEKRWIFRLAMGPAELLLNFRDDEDADVESVDEGDEVQPATE
jgi:hypothetical protein